MKPFYGIDRTTVKNNSFHEGGCFIAASVSNVVSGALEKAARESVMADDRAKLPLPLGCLHQGAGVFALLLFGGVIRGVSTVTFAQAYANAPWIFWLLGISAAVWLVLTIAARMVRKKAEGTGEFGIAKKRLDSAVDAAFRELGVPQNVKDVDIICIRFKWKDGKMKPVANGVEISEYTSEPFKVWMREDTLCLANVEHRYEISRQELKCLRVVKKHLYFQGWNKPEAPNQGFYKPYKLTVDKYERIHMKRYGILELEHEGEGWAIWLPPYELNYISALTGLEITE